jgi:hypothetical protein
METKKKLSFKYQKPLNKINEEDDEVEPYELTGRAKLPVSTKPFTFQKPK